MSVSSVFAKNLGIPFARFRLEADETVDDSDKTITVPNGKKWRILWIWIEFTTTATTGNRRLRIDIRDTSNDVILAIISPFVQAESNTYFYVVLPGGFTPNTSAESGVQGYLPMPRELILPSGYNIRIYDQNAVDASADDLIIQMAVLEVDE